MAAHRKRSTDLYPACRLLPQDDDTRFKCFPLLTCPFYAPLVIPPLLRDKKRPSRDRARVRFEEKCRQGEGEKQAAPSDPQTRDDCGKPSTASTGSQRSPQRAAKRSSMEGARVTLDAPLESHRCSYTLPARQVTAGRASDGLARQTDVGPGERVSLLPTSLLPREPSTPHLPGLPPNERSQQPDQEACDSSLQQRIARVPRLAQTLTIHAVRGRCCARAVMPGVSRREPKLTRRFL